MEDRIYDSNLILNKVFNDGNFDVRQDTNNILNAVYSEDDNALKVNVTNLPTPEPSGAGVWEQGAYEAAEGTYASYTGTGDIGALTVITVTADNIGVIPAGYGADYLDGYVKGDGVKTISELISDWNTSYPTFTISLISGDGTQVPIFRSGFTLINGTDELKEHFFNYQTVGTDCIAKGDYTIAEGEGSEASGYAAHAEGSYTTASGAYSHAEGISSTSIGDNSHAEGISSTSIGDNSHAEGNATTAHDYAEHVCGQYNIVGTGSTTSWNSTDNLLTLGNGANGGERSNAFQVKKNGQVIAGSSVKVGADSTTASVDNIGAIRYTSDATNSYCEMVMQTGASTYAWVVIKTNTWS